MPILNSKGQVLSGNGAQGAIEGIVFVDLAGPTNWYTDDIVIYNGIDEFGRWALRTYNQITKEYNVINPSGANFIAASIGRYASQAAGVLTGNFQFKSGSVMSLTSTDGRGAGRNGLIGLCNNKDCNSFTIYSDFNQEIVSAVAYDLFLINAYSAIWNGGSYNFSLDIPITLTGQKVIPLGDGDWIVGWSNKYGLVAILNSTNSGYILNPNPTAFHVDAINFENQLMVCWSLTVGERPQDIVKLIVDRTNPRIIFPDKPTPIPPDPIPIPPKPIPIPPNPIPTVRDVIMQLVSFDTSKGLIPVQSLKVSSQSGCVNVITPEGEVLSAHGDTRPSGTDGPWEQGQVNGNVVVFFADGNRYAYGFVMVDKLPK